MKGYSADDGSIIFQPLYPALMALVGVVDVHGPSTERLYLRASWTETVDDVTTDGPQQQSHTAIVTNSPVGPQERSGVVGLVDFQPSTAEVDLAEGTIGLHQGTTIAWRLKRTRYALSIDICEACLSRREVLPLQGE